MDGSNTQASLSGDALKAPTKQSLCKRLVIAKAQLDRLERDGSSKDLSALSAARIEFALASRALADALISQEAAEECSLS